MLKNITAFLTLFIYLGNTYTYTKPVDSEEESKKEYTFLGTSKKVDNNGPLDIYRSLKPYDFEMGETILSINWLPENNKIINVYFNMINPQSTYTYLFFVTGGYLLFLGIYTATISLSLVSAIFIFYFTEVLNNHLKDTESAILSHISTFLNFISTNVLYLVILSIFIALLLIFLLHVGRYIVPLLVAYIFYITYASFFNNLIYFIIIALILVIFMFISAIFNILKITLFSLTGSFLFLSTLEVLSGYDIGILELIGNLAIIKEIPTSFTIYVLFTLLGILVQVMYIPKS